tara:strand:- start:54 stop:557 length:504 start_codon:yes stop_codon:yes gene_type:complete
MPNLKLGTTTVISANNTLVSFPTGTLSGTLGDSASFSRGITSIKDSNGYFVANIKPRYISPWQLVTADDLQFSGTHGLSPRPITGYCQLATSMGGFDTSARPVLNVIGWPNVHYNTSDDTASFVFDATGWRVGIDNDKTHKQLFKDVDEDQEHRYRLSSYQFRVCLL